MAKITVFNHVTINVFNLERSLNFYKKLGAEVVHKGNKDAYLDLGGAWVCLQERPEYDQSHRNHIGFDHVAFSVSENDFQEAVDDLKNNKITIEKGPVKRGIGQSIYFRDPDGNLLEYHTSNLAERMTVWK
ncbi:MAG: VOC family protein [Tuberibacillus sp.]